ncbi:hypothetical protein ABMA28_014882 [Loxostege sticticalis]|uniref:BPTI/Kunitz inhibitor domain-containing protein n=1 Tax=Loxostege sticticalis TaxID=481309 RepID=A0ABD0TDL2_LOXSC
MKNGLDFVLLFVVFGRVGGDDDDVTLTTAVARIETTPKPTMIARRIHVDPNVEERVHAPLDLFRLRAPEIRRSRMNIWNWDINCQLQPQMGNCSESITRYYYDAQIDQCMTFTFTGCNENKNNFNSLVICERFCKGVAYTNIKKIGTGYPPFCYMQPNSGLCLAMFHMYYYNLNEGTCKPFVYGGCGGNMNRFKTMQECMTECHDD